METSVRLPNAPRTKDDELVLVVSSKLFRELGDFQGFRADALERYDALFQAENERFMRRGDAEFNPEFKQLVPYVLFLCFDRGARKIFAYRRGAGQGEARLRSKWSAGIGGHINDEDAQRAREGESDALVGLRLDASLDARATNERETSFERGARREIAEEVVIQARPLRFARVGFVNDDSTEVGSVHLGVVCAVLLEEPKMRSNEPDLLEARFRDLDDVLREIDEDPELYESWTALALRGLDSSLTYEKLI